MLRRSTVKFRPYSTEIPWEIMGKVKVRLRNRKGRKIRTTVYVVKGQVKSLLGRLDTEALGILTMNEEGKEGKCRRLRQVKKEKVEEEDGQNLQEEKEMEAIKEEYKDLFKGIGNLKIKPIHIFIKEGVEPVAQRQRPVAYHLMEPLKRHLQELKEEM